MAILNYSSILGQDFQGAGQVALRTQKAMQGLDINKQAIASNAFNMQQAQDQKEAQQQQLIKNQQLDAEAESIYKSGDINKVADFSIRNPERAGQILKAQGIVDSEGVKRVSDRFTNIMTSSDPLESLKTEIARGEEAGLDMSKSKQILAQNLPPEEIRKAAGMALASVDGARFKTISPLVFGGDAGTEIGTVSPKDFTVESMAKYQNSGDIKDLDRYTAKTVEVAGVTHSFDNETQKWEPIVDATSERLTNQAKAIATLEADKKSRVDFGKSKTKWQTGRPKFKSKIASSKASQKILEATSKQLKDNINNWSTKYGASLSSLPGSEARRLKNQLNTLKAHSAFSTLTDLKDSGGTLGAISEAELVLLEAKLGALDQGGDATELIRVIDQIVNSNTESIGRLETEFHNTNAMYSGSFDELDSARSNQTQESAGTQEGARATNPETGQVAIFTNGQWAVQ